MSFPETASLSDFYLPTYLTINPSLLIPIKILSLWGASPPKPLRSRFARLILEILENYEERRWHPLDLL